MMVRTEGINHDNFLETFVGAIFYIIFSASTRHDSVTCIKGDDCLNIEDQWKFLKWKSN